MHLAPGYSEEDVLKVLPEHAILVQGLWVAKSPLRCQNSQQSLIRDYILLLFSANRCIHHDQLKVLRVPNEILKHYLTPLAVERSTFNNWKFKEPEDCSFIKAYPDIVAEQRQGWLKREENIMISVRRRNTPAVARNSVRKGDQDQGRISTSDSADQGSKGGPDVAQSIGKTTMSAETRAALPKALLELFHNQKVCR